MWGSYDIEGVYAKLEEGEMPADDFWGTADACRPSQRRKV